MKIIKKYILTNFIKLYLKLLAALLTIVVITHIFDFLHVFLEKKPDIGLLVIYFLNRLPEWTVTMMPVATLLSVLFLLQSLLRHNEITAIKSSGIKTISALLPLIIFSIFLSGIAFLIYEGLAPKTNAYADNLFLIIRGREPRTISTIRKNFTYLGENKLYAIDRFEIDTITGFKIIEFFKGTTREKTLITAEKAVYDGKNWILHNGAKRKFSRKDGQMISYNKFTKKEIDIKETPYDFRFPKKVSEEMDFWTLQSHIRKLNRGGFSTLKEEVLLHHKIAFPFSNTIILILGIPLALWGGVKNRIRGFFISLLICFAYWGAISIGKSLGTGGILPPALGAWAANIVFGSISILMFGIANE